MHTCYLSIGSNLGNRILNCQQVIKELQPFVTLLTQSSFYETEPWGYQDKNYYINAVIHVETSLDPYTLLSKIKLIEENMGRSQKNPKFLYEARIIDVDILFFDNLIIDVDSLIIPHPKMCNRNYVLMPFFEINPYFQCPSTHKNITELIQECTDKSEITICAE